MVRDVAAWKCPVIPGSGGGMGDGIGGGGRVPPEAGKCKARVDSLEHARCEEDALQASRENRRCLTEKLLFT